MAKIGGKFAVAYTSLKEGGYKELLSAGLDFIPVVGNAKALVEAVIGRDPITGRKLEKWERAVSAAVIVGGPLVKGAKHASKAVAGIASGSKATNKTVNLAKSPTPTNPTKQQAPSPPAKSKEQSRDTGNVGTPPRYGDRQISDEEYDMLRGLTPTQKLRDKINEGHDKKLVTQDKVLPGKTFKGALEADHIVSMDKISKMDGFDKLTKDQKLEVLNNSDNFTGLSKSANTSKQSKSYEEWTHYKKGKPGEIEVNPEFREKMMVKEKELERKLQKQIDDFNDLNKKGR